MQQNTLDPNIIKQRLEENYPDWFLTPGEDQKLASAFEFTSFDEAVNFVNAIAEVANDEEHHPDVFIYDYKFVQILTSTHDANGITEKDFALVSAIEAMLNERGEESQEVEETEEASDSQE